MGSAQFTEEETQSIASLIECQFSCSQGKGQVISRGFLAPKNPYTHACMCVCMRTHTHFSPQANKQKQKQKSVTVMAMGSDLTEVQSSLH